MIRDHPVSDKKIALDFPEYTRLLVKRLRAGADSYGDGSFYQPGEQICAELEQEVLDIAGWGFIAWCKIRELEQKMREAEARCAGTSSLSQSLPLFKRLLQRSRLFASRSLGHLRRRFGRRLTRDVML